MDNATPTPDVPQMPATTEEIMATLQSSYEALCAVKTNVRAALLAAGAIEPVQRGLYQMQHTISKI